MKDIFGIPLVENALLPKGTAFLVVQDKGLVTQMVKVYDEMEQMSTSDLIAELEKRRPCGGCDHIGFRDMRVSAKCQVCAWGVRQDNFKEAK